MCKLTGDAVNKSEEHIWKHVSGKKFQNMLGILCAEMKKDILLSYSFFFRIEIYFFFFVVGFLIHVVSYSEN